MARHKGGNTVPARQKHFAALLRQAFIANKETGKGIHLSLLPPPKGVINIYSAGLARPLDESARATNAGALRK